MPGIRYVDHRCENDLAPGVSEIIDEAIKNNNIPFAQSSRLCSICFELIDTTSHATPSCEKICNKCNKQRTAGLKRERQFH